jgi:hypothetical protein
VVAISDILFSNPLALVALSSVIPLIILYLLRPRTIDLKIPSLIFFVKREQQRNKLSLLLRKLIRDPLFFIQLLVLILLSLAMAGPFMLEEKVSGQHTVIVIDNSASMQAGDRLDLAKARAVENLSGINSVVWAQNVPVLALKEGDSTRAKEVIALTPQRAVSADLAAAITYAQRLAGSGGNVVVFSDFASWIGDYPVVAKNLAEYNGVRVEFVQVGQKSGNIGIVNGWLDMKDGIYNLNLAVKNFNDNKEHVSLTVQTGSATRGGSLDIPARETRAYIVPDLGTGTTQVSLDNGGALEIDDTAYVFIPATASSRILMVDTRSETSTAAALALLPLSVEHTTSLPLDISAYSILILGNLNNGSLGSASFEALAEFVRNGGILIASASAGLINFESDLLPIAITGVSNETDLNIITDSPLIHGIPVTDIEVVKHIKGTAPVGATIIANAGDGSPMLSYWRREGGTVVYIGMNDITGDDAWSGFNTLPEFPLFWKNMFDWLGGTNLDERNIKTGTMIRLASNQTITHPDGSTVTTTNVWIDQTGIYHIGSQAVAANLYDASESDVDDISLDASSLTSKYIERPETIRTEIQKDLSAYVIWAVLGLVLLELIVIQRRRELF